MNFHERTEQAMATIAAMDALLRDTAGGQTTTSAAQALLAQGKLDDLRALLEDLFDAADSVRANVPLPDDIWLAILAWLREWRWRESETHVLEAFRSERTIVDWLTPPQAIWMVVLRLPRTKLAGDREKAWLLIPCWDGREAQVYAEGEAHYYLADQHRLATGGS